MHVRDGQVVGPDRRLFGAGVQVDVDGDLPAGEVDAVARVADRAAARSSIKVLVFKWQ